MHSWIRHSLTTAAVVLSTATPASAVPVVPPGAAWDSWGAAPSCPLYWSPGAPLSPVPHPEPAPIEPGGRLLETSGAAALAEARGWIEVGRPGDAMAVLATAPPTDPGTRLYRVAALAGLGSWEDLDAALDSVSAA